VTLEQLIGESLPVRRLPWTNWVET